MEIVKAANKYQVILMFLGGILATAVTLTAYAFTTFQTKEDNHTFYSMLEKRLDRIESKVDELLGAK